MRLSGEECEHLLYAEPAIGILGALNARSDSSSALANLSHRSQKRSVHQLRGVRAFVCERSSPLALEISTGAALGHSEQRNRVASKPGISKPYSGVVHPPSSLAYPAVPVSPIRVLHRKYTRYRSTLPGRSRDRERLHSSHHGRACAIGKRGIAHRCRVHREHGDERERTESGLRCGSPLRSE